MSEAFPLSPDDVIASELASGDGTTATGEFAEVGPAHEGQSGHLRGDLTQGPILRTLITFSIPMLIGNVIQTLNGSINAIWVGRLIGTTALAATTVANVVMFLLFAGVFGLGNATTVRVGQHFGARDIAGARRTFGGGLGFCVVFAAVIAGVGWVVAPAVLRAMATPAGSYGFALTYLRVVFVTMPFGTVSLMMSMGMRGAGDSRTPLTAMILTVTLDILFNPLLIRGFGPIPPLGIAGSAISTAAANFAGVVVMLLTVYRRDLPLRLRGSELGFLIPRKADLAYILSKGIPMSGQMFLIASAQMAIVRLVDNEGAATTAAYGASMQLWNYLQMPAFAISMGVSAMVAQSIGAGKHSRVSAVTRAGMISNVAMTGVLAALVTLAAHPLLALFLGGDSPALPIARHIQHVVTWTYLIMGASMIVTGTLRAYGVVLAPLIIQALAYYPVRLGFYFLAYPHFGAEALWWSFPVASAFSAVLTWWVYAHGGWRARRGAAFVAPGLPG